MKKEKVMSFISTLGILILLIGIGISIISVFFNKMIPGRIISPDFPPFYLFFIGIVILVFGFLLFFWKKIQKMGKKKIGIIVTLIIVFFVILSLPIISRSLETHTGRFIRYDEVVWTVNESINSESEVRNYFNSHLINFLESSLNITKEHDLWYPDNPEPILEQMNIKFDEHHKVWRISIPIISKGADWNIGFFDGYINGASYMHFSMTKDTGIVRIEC